MIYKCFIMVLVKLNGEIGKYDEDHSRIGFHR